MTLLAASGSGCVTAQAGIGEDQCRRNDVAACIVQCDEGHGPSCAKLASFDSWAAAHRGAALQRACAARSPKACARVATYLLVDGKPADAFALANPFCTQVEWYPCMVAADAMAGIAFPKDDHWSPVPLVQLTREAAPNDILVGFPRDVMESGRTQTVVRLIVGIASDGQVVSAEVVESAGTAVDRYASFMVRRATWIPAQVDGISVDSFASHSCRFIIDNEL